MRKYFNIFVLLATCLPALPTWAMEVSPDVLVDNTAQEVLAIARQDKDIRAGNKGRLLELVEAKVLPHFDFTRMTRLAMGKNWSKAASEQQQQLVNEFRTLLVRTYSNAFTTYRDHAITVEPLKGRIDDSNTTVRTQVIRGQGQQPISIDYSMAKTEAGWKVYDVTVAGVSLVSNYRSTFNSQIHDGGVEKLIKTLTDKNRALIATDNTSDASQ
ncbi:MAG: ABC transporter substrate-binding protein [Nitrosospira sp.]